LRQITPALLCITFPAAAAVPDSALVALLICPVRRVLKTWNPLDNHLEGSSTMADDHMPDFNLASLRVGANISIDWEGRFFSCSTPSTSYSNCDSCEQSSRPGSPPSERCSAGSPACDLTSAKAVFGNHEPLGLLSKQGQQLEETEQAAADKHLPASNDSSAESMSPIASRSASQESCFSWQRQGSICNWFQHKLRLLGQANHRRTVKQTLFEAEAAMLAARHASLRTRWWEVCFCFGLLQQS